jgi:alkanesulfonate monooxygenase SsuD/methylene tetrahydromethanopterin reductase-like flavin-dependent oxidoreductase (luciferase family)
VKLGVLLPTFRTSSDEAFAVAERAASAGLDGVFAFDHLWPMGSPTRPALAPFPVLSAVAARWATLSVGPLVARVSLVGSPTLVEQFTTLDALAPGRVVAALGTGDHLSRDEDVAFGLGYPSANERRAMLRDVAAALPTTMTLWVGAGSPATNRLARELGAVINLWGVAPEEVVEVGEDGPVSWAGPLGDDIDATLTAIAEAGATWAVSSEPSRLDELLKWRLAN